MLRGHSAFFPGGAQAGLAAQAMARRRLATSPRRPLCACVAAMLLVCLGRCSARALTEAAPAPGAAVSGTALGALAGGGDGAAAAPSSAAAAALAAAHGAQESLLTTYSTAEGAQPAVLAQPRYARLPATGEGAAAAGAGPPAVQRSAGSSGDAGGAGTSANALGAPAAASGVRTPAAPAPLATAAEGPAAQAAGGGSAVTGIAAGAAPARTGAQPAGASAPALGPPGGAGSAGEGEPAAASGRAAAPAPAAGSSVLGYTTGARASGADVGASQTVTLLAPRGGGGGQEAAAARRHNGRGGAQGPSAGLPGGSYSQPALHKVGAFQLAAMQARPRALRARRAPGSAASAEVGCVRRGRVTPIVLLSKHEQ